VRVDGAFLEFSRDGRQHTVALGTQRFTLGRASGNDLSFPQDDAVSGRHAVIERQADGWLITDLGSTNGTSVNGQVIRGPRVLGSGDLIRLGPVQLAFRATAAAQEPPTSPTAALPLPAAAPPAGYLDATEEWAGSGAPLPAARPPQAPPRRAERAPAPAGPDGSAGRGPAARDSRGPGPAAGPVGRPEDMRGHAVIRGTARNIQVRTVDNGKVLGFRVERYDAAGNRLPPVGAEFAGYRGGQLSDGDDVEAAGKWSRGTLRAKTVTNLSTGAQVRGTPGSAKFVVGCFFVLVCLFILGVALAIILSR
jgi:hypothetical protein